MDTPNLKRKLNQVSLEDINITDDIFLDVSRKIFIYHYREKFDKTDRSIYQTESQRHPLYSNVVVCPHFVRDDGVIIYLELVQNKICLKNINENIVQLSMEVFKSNIAIVYQIILKENINMQDLLPAQIDISQYYNKIIRQKYTYDATIVINFLANIGRKKIKTEDNPNNDTNSEFDPRYWVSASKTRNYALKDTLIDWLDYYYDKQELPVKKNTTNKLSGCKFLDFLFNKGKKFEENVIDLIKKKSKPGEFVTICSNMNNFNKKILEYEQLSINEIIRGTPIIYQPVLMNHTGPISYSYGMPDLLVRSDYLDTIITKTPLSNKMKKFHASKLNGDYHYVVVDIKFSTLDLCSDGKRIRNSGSIPAYKCQLYVYNHALGVIQGYEPSESYILGRKYKYISNGYEFSDDYCFARLGHIEYHGWDSEYLKKTTNAINWIKDLRTKGKKWKLLPKPTVPELYPNMSSQFETPWYKIKLDAANKIGEITLLWNCGVKNREIAHQNNIYSFRDPRCNPKNIGVNGVIQKPILNEIIKINRKRKFDTMMDYISIKLNNSVDNIWTKASNLTISVDFENISNIFDDFQNLPCVNNNHYLYMIGVAFHTNENLVPIYKSFVLPELSDINEFQMIKNFYYFLREITDIHLGTSCPIPSLYHWGHAEKSLFYALSQKLQNLFPKVLHEIKLIEENLDWYDLSQCFRNNPIVINGCFKFGLKEIANRLHELGLIKANWNSNSCSNGASAMVMAEEIYRNLKIDNLSVEENKKMNEIISYNKIDCTVIHEIIQLLQKKVAADGLIEPPNKKRKL